MVEDPIAMKTSLDCIPCILRQTIDAARFISEDPNYQYKTMQDALGWLQEMDLNLSPPAIAQMIHRNLRRQSFNADPYQEIKKKQNQLALDMIPDLRLKIQFAPDPLIFAARLAIAGNVIDLGVNGNLKSSDIRQAIDRVLSENFIGEAEEFRRAVADAHSILYLADNAGEIVFDRLLIEQLRPERVTLVVRGMPVINDATLDDAREAGLDKIVKVIGNGSDAPGTTLEDCSSEFQQLFREADLIIAKGQGNFETLDEVPATIFFLFKVKCQMFAGLVNQPIGTQILIRGKESNSRHFMEKNNKKRYH